MPARQHVPPVPGHTAAEGARSGPGPGAFLASSLASVLTDGRSRPRRGGRRLPRVSVCVAGSDRGQTESRRCTRGHGRAPPRGSQRFVGRGRRYRQPLTNEDLSPIGGTRNLVQQVNVECE